MKTALIIGWICCSLEILILCGSFFLNGSSEASGDAIAKDMRSVLALYLLPATGLLLWGTMTGHPIGVRGGVGLTTFPFAVAMLIGAPKLVPNFGSILGSVVQNAGLGSFDDPRLTALAKALSKEDVAKQRELVSSGPIDWKARDKKGYTILGFAVKQCIESYATPANYEGVKILLAAGAPVANDVLSESDGKDYLIAASSGGSPELLTILLEAGGDANAKTRASVPVVFETMYRPAHFRLLIDHGADVNAIDNEWMNPGQSLLMRLVHEQQWAEADYLMKKSPNLAHRANNGSTLASLLQVEPGQEAAAIQAKLQR